MGVTDECCDLSIQSALQWPERKGRTYCLVCEDVAVRERGRCLYFPDVMTFGCELLAKVFCCHQACASGQLQQAVMSWGEPP